MPLFPCHGLTPFGSNRCRKKKVFLVVLGLFDLGRALFEDGELDALALRERDLPTGEKKNIYIS